MAIYQSLGKINFWFYPSATVFIIPGETHLSYLDKTPFLCINEGIGIYRLIDFFKVIVMVKLLSISRD